MTDKDNEKNTCPSWAEELIEYLRQVEVYRGTIPDHPHWQDESIKKLASRVTSEEAPIFDEYKLEYLFKKIITKLHEKKYSAEEITSFINKRIKLQNGPKYCSLEEVKRYIP